MGELKDNPVLLNDMFEVKELNPDGKKFDKVTRLRCKSETYDLDMMIDVNSDLFPCKPSERLAVALAHTLNLEGKPDPGIYDQSGKPSLLDDYEYAMHGTVFHYDKDGQAGVNVSVYVSFGGLLCRIKGDQRHLSSIEQDQKLYCLMRKVRSG